MIFTIEEAAAYLKVSKHTVYRCWRSLGGFKVGREIRFYKQVIDYLLLEAIENESNRLRDQSRDKMELRLLLSENQISKEGLPNKAASQSRREQNERKVVETEEDKFGFRGIVRKIHGKQSIA
jgi:excisionase family DNA binding protein